MTLYEEYISEWEDFESKLLVFDDQTRAKIKRKLMKEKNKTTFFSKITEINFGLLYAENGAVAEYEIKYEFHNYVKEPDWTIYFNSQKIICEVLRLNTTQTDQFRNDFDNRLIDQISKIKGNYVLKIFFLNEDFQESLYDINNIVDELKYWLLIKRSLNDQITLYGNFKFKILAVDTPNKCVHPVGNTNIINIDTRRLESSRSEFYKKIVENAELIEYLNLPFIINLYTPVTSGIDAEHLFYYLYGTSVEDRVNNSEYTLLDKGLFYNDDNAKKYLSGVLFRRGNNVLFFYNYNLENKLNRANKEFFTKYKYTL